MFRKKGSCRQLAPQGEGLDPSVGNIDADTPALLSLKHFLRPFNSKVDEAIGVRLNGSDPALEGQEQGPVFVFTVPDPEIAGEPGANPRLGGALQGGHFQSDLCVVELHDGRGKGLEVRETLLQSQIDL